MSTPYINSSFLNGFSQLVILKGGNPAALYELVGLDKEVLLKKIYNPERLKICSFLSISLSIY